MTQPMDSVQVEDLGLSDYKETWDYQEQLFNALINDKIDGKPRAGHILLCQHPHVYTLGKHGEQNNLLISDSFLDTIDATFYKIDRGGDITYHGPGQLVCYPVIDLDVHGIGIRSYIQNLESSVIRMLANFQMEAYLLDNITGVWIKDQKTGQDKKICAIGVRASRGVTMHGLALNVNTDLKYFDYINPCGFSDKGVTSMQALSGHEWDMNIVKEKLLTEMKDIFGFTIS